ncbi:hypothetical protein [Mucilaginibacter daejeonensis]|nr:hypothetical protein [Mucilaginibacter daejeonensis]
MRIVKVDNGPPKPVLTGIRSSGRKKEKHVSGENGRTAKIEK